MPTEIPDLWGNDIDMDVVPPLVILKAQAAAISKRTRGVLKGEVSSNHRPEGGNEYKFDHTLILEAPSLIYQEDLLTISHDEKRLYPVWVNVPTDILWKGVRASPNILEEIAADTPGRSCRCDDQQELLKALTIALSSAPTKSTLNSLLAKVNETKLVKK